MLLPYRRACMRGGRLAAARTPSRHDRGRHLVRAPTERLARNQLHLQHRHRHRLRAGPAPGARALPLAALCPGFRLTLTSYLAVLNTASGKHPVIAETLCKMSSWGPAPRPPALQQSDDSEKSASRLGAQELEKKGVTGKRGGWVFGRQGLRRSLDGRRRAGADATEAPQGCRFFLIYK